MFLGGTQKFHQELCSLFHIKGMTGIEQGEVLPIVLPTNEQPVFIERTFQDNHKDGTHSTALYQTQRHYQRK